MNMSLGVEDVVIEIDRHLIVVALERDMRGDEDQSKYSKLEVFLFLLN